jgi:hypothetical protein
VWLNIVRASGFASVPAGARVQLRQSVSADAGTRWTPGSPSAKIPVLPMKSPSCFRALAIAAALSLCAAAAFAADGFALKDTPGDYLDVLSNGRIVARYMYNHDVSDAAKRDEHYKPFLAVFDNEGKEPITKGAGGTLPHHRGIYIGWNQIKVGDKTYDRWHMKGGDQVHDKFLNQSAGPDKATFTSHIRWEGNTPEEVIIDEERTMTFLPATAPFYAVIEVTSKLKAVAGDTTLNPDAEHSGLQYRPADKIDRKFTTYIYPKADANPHKDRDYPWFGESYTVDGKQYSVVYLSHPSNRKDAIISAYRDYGRFGQTWSDSLKKDEVRELRARFLIAAGDMPSAEVIQKAWNEYAGQNEPVPQVTAKPAEKTNFADPNNPKPPAPAKGEKPAKPEAKPDAPSAK